MSWLGKQILFSGAALIAVLLLSEFSNLDLLLQTRFFDAQSGSWIWDKDEPVLKFILYDGVRFIYGLGAISLLAFVAFCGNLPSLESRRRGLLIVSVSLLLIPLVVNVLKDATNIPCPRNLEAFGGEYPHITLFSGFPQGSLLSHNVACFPAGHASGAFALLSIFFLVKKKRNRVMLVISVLLLAWIIGLYKMIIGDHFLSHTIVSMLLSWLLILGVAHVFDPKFEPYIVS